MKQILGLGIGALLVLAGCSTNRRLLTPDPAARQMISPEACEDECDPCGDEPKPCMDAVCGDVNSYPAGGWRSRHKGAEYIFDCEECKTCFDAAPDLYTGR